MKEFVIGVVTTLTWLGFIFFTLIGFGIGVQISIGHAVVGSLLGLVVGCVASGFWLILVSINEKLSILADAAMRTMSDRGNVQRAMPEQVGDFANDSSFSALDYEHLDTQEDFGHRRTGDSTNSGQKSASARIDPSFRI